MFEDDEKKPSLDYDLEVTPSSGCFKWLSNHYSIYKMKWLLCRWVWRQLENVLNLYTSWLWKNCLPEKIFIMNIKSLFWTKISKQTSIHKEANSRPGLMSFEDRIAIWLEGIIEDHKFNSTCLCSGIIWIPRPWSMATLSIQVLRKLFHLW